jgi:DNA-binding MarR family transcriptional regulator
MADEPLQLVRSIHRATHRIGLYLAGLQRAGVSQGEAHILARLASSSPATIGELHADLAHNRSTLTSILDRLVERGLVTRAPGVDDRRTFIVATTAAGRVVAARVQRHLVVLERAVGRRVGARDLRACVRVLAAVEEQARAATRAAPARR